MYLVITPLFFLGNGKLLNNSMNINFKIIFFNFLFLMGGVSFSQFEFQIVDEVTYLPIEYTKVTLESGKTFYADSMGVAITDSSNIYHVSSLGYKQRTVTHLQVIKSNYRVVLSERILELDEISIETNTLSSYRINDGIRQKEEISTEDVSATLTGTAPDILEQSGQVYVQKSQQGGGSPVLRGFEANRVLLLVDGIRMNNAMSRKTSTNND